MTEFAATQGLFSSKVRIRAPLLIFMSRAGGDAGIGVEAKVNGTEPGRIEPNWIGEFEGTASPKFERAGTKTSVSDDESDIVERLSEWSIVE
jgi:hypothetical protein